MGKAINFIKEDSVMYYIYMGHLHIYSKNESKLVYEVFDGQRLLINDIYYHEVMIKKGFKFIENREHEFVPINKKEIIQEIKDKQKFYNQITDYHSKKNLSESWTNDIYLFKEASEGDIQSFYELELEIEVKGTRVKCERSDAYEDKVYVRIPRNNEELRLKYHEVFGEPQPIPESIDARTATWYWNCFFIIDKKDIDKIIGIKRYLDISSFGEVEKKFTGEVEEIVLDMRNFDEKTYQFFKEHGMLEIEEIK